MDSLASENVIAPEVPPYHLGSQQLRENTGIGVQLDLFCGDILGGPLDIFSCFPWSWLGASLSPLVVGSADNSFFSLGTGEKKWQFEMCRDVSPGDGPRECVLSWKTATKPIQR